MMKTFALMASATLLAATAALAQSPQTNSNPPKPSHNTNAVSAMQDKVGGMVGMISAEMTSTAKGFVTAAAISDHYEIEAGKMAATRARDPKLKAFAQEMVTA